MSEVGRRCPSGCETWPNDAEYAQCPICGDETKVFRGVEPLARSAARSKRLHVEFDAYYEARGDRVGDRTEP